MIADNSAGRTNTVGDAVSFSGGLHVGIPVDFNITDSLIAGNRVNAPRLGSSPGFTHGDGGAGQLFGHMRRTRVHGNTVTATSDAGHAEAMAGGLRVQSGQMTDSTLRGNRPLAVSRNASATVRGAGAVVDTPAETPAKAGSA